MILKFQIDKKEKAYLIYLRGLIGYEFRSNYVDLCVVVVDKKHPSILNLLMSTYLKLNEKGNTLFAILLQIIHESKLTFLLCSVR